MDTDAFIHRFGERLGELRVDKGLSRAELALAACVSAEHLGRLERGEAQPSFPLIGRLAQALDAAPADLFLPPGETRACRLVTRHAGDVVWTCDADLRLTYISPSVTRMMGYTPKEAMVRDLLWRVAPGSRQALERLAAEVKGLVQEGRYDAIDHRLQVEQLCKDGSGLWVEFTLRAVTDPGVGFVELVGVSRDIGEQRRLEKALRRRDERLARFMDRAEEVIWHTDETLRFTQVSPGIKALSGYTPEEFVRLDYEDFMAPASAAQVRVAAQERLEAEARGQGDDRQRVFRLQYRRKDGRLLWVETTTTPLRGEDGRFLGLSGVLRDVDEEVRAARRLAKSEDMVRSLLNATTDSAFLIDADGTFLAANEIGAERLGSTPEELVGMNARQVAPWEVFERRMNRVWDAIETGKPVRFVDERPPIVFDNLFSPIFDAEGCVSMVALFAQDITERARAEEELARSRFLLEEAERVAGLGGFEWDMEADRWRMTDNWLAIHGYHKAEPNTAELYTLAHPEDLEHIAAAFQQALSTGRYECEHRVVRPESGEVRHIRAVGEVRYDREGRPRRMTGAALDITERRRADEALAASRRQFQDVLDNCPLAVFIKDAQGRNLFVNQALAKALGMRRSQILGKNTYEVMPREQARAMEANARLVWERGRAMEMEESLTLDGQTRHYLTTLFPLRDAQGAIYALCGMAQDISERKRMEEDLAASEERFRTVADFTYDCESWAGADGRVEYISPSCGRVTGYAPEEFYADPSLQTAIIHPDDRPRMEALFRETEAAGQVADEEFRILTRTGEERWVHHICQPVFDATGRYRGRRCSRRDITERKRQEAMREDVERIIRHDLRSPLLSLLAGSRLLEQFADLSERERMVVGEMKATAARTLRMAEQTLELAALERGALRKKLEPCDLCDIVAGVLRELAPQADAAEVTLKALGLDRPAPVRCDEALCHSMLLNLMKNAVEASDAGRAVEVELRMEDGAVEVAVHNHQAVHPAVREVFFDKYATHGKQDGTGLGAYAARLMARSHGGDVTMRSSDEDGTTVTVSLPLAEG